MSRRIGYKIEQLALKYILDKDSNFKLVSQNFYSKFGEIDLILLNEKDKLLVFCEVRGRKLFSQVSAMESITKQKINKIIVTAEYFLQKNSCFINYQCRFDVVTVVYQVNDTKNMSIIWLKDAFSC